MSGSYRFKRKINLARITKQALEYDGDFTQKQVRNDMDKEFKNPLFRYFDILEEEGVFQLQEENGSDKTYYSVDKSSADEFFGNALDHLGSELHSEP